MTGTAVVSLSPLPTVYNVTGGGGYCVGATGAHVILSGSSAGTNYQLYLGTTAVGTPRLGTGVSLDFGPQTGLGVYTVVATGIATGCSNNMTGSVTVSLNPLPTAYNVTGGGGYCAGGTGVLVGLSSSNTSISYQLYRGSLPVGSPLAGTGGAISYGLQTTPGTYTISLNRSSATNQTSATSGIVNYTGTLTGQITVTVVAASAGGSYSAAYSLCNTRSNSQGHGIATGIDTTSAITNGQTAYIAFDLDDAYDSSLDAGALVVSATGGALISLAANGSTAAAGTTSTVVSTVAPTNQVVQVTQGTANAPQITTVTITFNGTTVCTKTITIRGEIAKLEIANIGTGDINSANSITAGASTWIANTLGDAARAGLFTVVGRDSAGNAVVTNSGGTFSADSATLTTTVQALSVPETATSVSSSSAAFGIYGVGTWTCGAAAGSSNVKLKWTNSGSGTVVTSDAFAARCADDPYTYTASWDKASYVAGEIATLTVQFLDSKGNKANNAGAHGAATITAPMFTAVTSHTGTVSNKADGSRVYTFTVGKDTGITAGTYTSIVEYASLVAGTKQTPTYKVGTGTSEVTNAEVLKSIVALIASINKQIQALQKLLLKK